MKNSVQSSLQIAGNMLFLSMSHQYHCRHRVLKVFQRYFDNILAHDFFETGDERPGISLL